MTETPGPHHITDAVQRAIDALQDLAATVARSADASTVRRTAHLMGLPRNTLHRWRTDPPGLARLIEVRQALRDNNAG